MKMTMTDMTDNSNNKKLIKNGFRVTRKLFRNLVGLRLD